MTSDFVRVGVDLAAVDDVAEALERFGDRYARRVYTEGELIDCAGDPVVRARSLAARFAAKEATLKALRAGDDAPPWTSIETRRRADGSPRLVLYGEARRLAQEAGLNQWAVSLSHEGKLAAAVVIGSCESGTGDPWRTNV